MLDYQLVVLSGPVRNIQARVAGLLIPLDIEIVSMQLCPSSDPETKRIQLSVRVPSTNRLELLIKRLNRMVDVVKVWVLDPSEHHRQSCYVAVHPPATELMRVLKIIQAYRAEILELTDNGVLVHLNASPAPCTDFLADLEPYNVSEAVSGAVTSFRFRTRASGQAVRPASVSV